ncbi:MAG TPA: YhjD/YihY/BrkB family envelope integrity protein [Sedimentisphaerales bacterium]|nr:YhjD/YihY/BrkB family envelope integrity protein [Sedimentisphaerales bacterium]
MLTLENLLTTPTTQVGKAGRFVIFQIKLWSHCARLLKINRSGQQAAALSYHTIFGIVPLAIVTLLIFQSFPSYSYIGEKVKNFIYDQANLTAFNSPVSNSDNPEETIKLTEHLDAIVARFFAETNKGQIGLFSILIVIWAALSLLATIEKSFNNIWHVATGRNFLHRIISYWALLTLGPLLLGTGIYVITRYSKIANIHETVLSYVAPVILSYFVATVAFFLLYFVMPNTKVNFKAAIWGAAVAALVWMAAKSIFGYCITELGLYRTVYGVMALIPMTVVWIYITWLTVLFGLQLTYTTQHLKSLDAAEIAAAKKTEEYFIANDLTIINIVREIAAAFQDNQAPVPPEEICSKLGIPAEFGQKILDHLVKSRLIVRTSDPVAGFLPAKDPANIKLSEITEAMETAGFAQPASDRWPGMQQIAESQRNILARHTLKEILNPQQETTGPSHEA